MNKFSTYHYCGFYNDFLDARFKLLMILTNTNEYIDFVI